MGRTSTSWFAGGQEAVLAFATDLADVIVLLRWGWISVLSTLHAVTDTRLIVRGRVAHGLCLAGGTPYVRYHADRLSAVPPRVRLPRLEHSLLCGALREHVSRWLLRQGARGRKTSIMLSIGGKEGFQSFSTGDRFYTRLKLICANPEATHEVADVFPSKKPSVAYSTRGLQTTA